MSATAALPTKTAETAVERLNDPQQWGLILDLPCELSMELAVHDFKVADLLRLQAGSIVSTKWAEGEDVPLRVNGETVALGEFEAVGGSLGLRITEWA